MKEFKEIALILLILSSMAFSIFIIMANECYAQIDEVTKRWSFAWEHYKSQQYRDAIKHFWVVVEIDTTNKFPSVYRYLGNSYMNLIPPNPDSAQVVFNLGIQKQPNDSYLHQNLRFLFTLRGQVPEAIKHAKRIVEIEPESAEAWKALARLYVKDKRNEDSIQAYKKVLEIKPDDLEALKELKELLKLTGNIEEVINQLKRIAENEPANSQARFELGEIYFKEGDYESSIKWFKEFLTLSPDDVAVMEYIGVSFTRLEKYNDAISQFQKILELEPKNKKIMVEISRAHKEQEKFSVARAYAAKALKVDDVYGDAWLALGEAYEAGANACSEQNNGPIEFDDRLVYELAYQKYKLAAKDLAFVGNATDKMDYLHPLLPTKEDIFMHKNRSPRSVCYKWIPTAEFNDNYCKALNRRVGMN